MNIDDNKLSLTKKKAPLLSDEIDNETHITLDDSIYTDFSADLHHVDHSPVVVGSELEIHSARSADSNVTDKNSLFQRSDMRSVESYMSQILPEHEDAPEEIVAPPAFNMGFLQIPSISTTSTSISLHNINNSSLSSSDNIPASVTSSSLKTFPIITTSSPMAHLNSEANLSLGGSVSATVNNGYEVKLLNISAWKLESTSVQLRALNFKIAEFISYRESLLRQLESLLQSLDRAYWQYAVVRIETVAKNVPQALMYEPVVLSRNRVFMMQQQVSVCLAHIRAISISICESVVKLRSMCRKEIETTAPVSIYYKGDNYLVKMWSDLRQIMTQSPTLILYWMGFIPDPLIIPPEEHMHRPRERWLSLTKPIVAAIKKDLIVKRDREKRAAHQQLHRIRMSVQNGRASPRISSPSYQPMHNKLVDSPDGNIQTTVNGTNSVVDTGRQLSAPASTPPATTEPPVPGTEDALLSQAISTPTSRLIRRAGMLMSHAMEKQIFVENLQGPAASAPVSSRPNSSANQLHLNNKNSPSNNVIPLLRVESTVTNKIRQPLEDWEQLREYCRHSWKRLEIDLPLPSPYEYMNALNKMKNDIPTSLENDHRNSLHSQQNRGTVMSNHSQNHFPSPPTSAIPSLHHHHHTENSHTHINHHTGSPKIPSTSIESLNRPISFSVLPYPPKSGNIIANSVTAGINNVMSSSFDENYVSNDTIGNNTLNPNSQFQVSVWTQQLEQAVDVATGTGQGFFSAHVHTSPFVMEAAFGLNETWPSISIVPVLPTQLRQRCIRLYEEVLLAEVYNVLAIDQTRKELQEKQMEHFLSVCQSSFTVLPANVPAVRSQESMHDMYSIFSEEQTQLPQQSLGMEAIQWTNDLSMAESEALAIALALREQLTQRRWQLWHDTQQHLLEDSTADAYNYNPSHSTNNLQQNASVHRHDPLRTNTPSNLTGNFTVKDNLKKKHHKKRSILIPDSIEPQPTMASEMETQATTNIETKLSTAIIKDKPGRQSLLLTSSPFRSQHNNNLLLSTSASAVTKVHQLNSLDTIEHAVHKQSGLLCQDEDSIQNNETRASEVHKEATSVFLTEDRADHTKMSDTFSSRHSIKPHSNSGSMNDPLDELAAAIVAKAPPLTLKRAIARNLRDRVDDERRVVALNPVYFAHSETHTTNDNASLDNVSGTEVRTSKLLITHNAVHNNTLNNTSNMFILRPDRKRHRQREMDRLDAKYRDLHATNIQRIMRAFLAKKKTRKLRNQRAWRRVLMKLQTLVRGFITRLRRQREQHEAKIAIFIVRKQALARFRASVTITRAFRSMVNLRRLMKREPLLPDKLDKYGKPVSSSEQRRTLVRLLQKKPSFLIAATDALAKAHDEDKKTHHSQHHHHHKKHGHHHHHHLHRNSHHQKKKEHNAFDPAMVLAPHMHPQLQLLMNKSQRSMNKNTDDESVVSSSSNSITNNSMFSMDSGVSSTNSSMIMQRIQHQQRKSRPFTPIIESPSTKQKEDAIDEEEEEEGFLQRRDDSSVSDDDSAQQFGARPSYFDHFDEQQELARSSSQNTNRQLSGNNYNSDNKTNLTATEWAQTQLRLKSDAAAFVRKLHSQQLKPPPDRLRHSRLLPSVLGQNSAFLSTSTSSAGVKTVGTMKSTPSNNLNSRLKPFCRKTPLTFMDFNHPASSSLPSSSSTDSFFHSGTQSITQQVSYATPSSTSSSLALATTSTPLPALMHQPNKTTPLVHSFAATEEVHTQSLCRSASFFPEAASITVSGPPLTMVSQSTPEFNLHKHIFKPPPILTIVTEHSCPNISVPSPFAMPPTAQQLSVQTPNLTTNNNTTNVMLNNKESTPNNTENVNISKSRDTVPRYGTQPLLHAAIARPNDVYHVPIGISTSTLNNTSSNFKNKPFQKSMSSSLNTSSFISNKSNTSNNSNDNCNNNNNNNAPAVRGIHSVRQARLEAKRQREEAETARMREALARLIL